MIRYPPLISPIGKRESNEAVVLTIVISPNSSNPKNFIKANERTNPKAAVKTFMSTNEKEALLKKLRNLLICNKSDPFIERISYSFSIFI